MRFPGTAGIGLALLLLATPAPPALAGSGRTPPEATQHAVDELANAIAQHKVTLTPPPSLTSTPTPIATSTATPAPALTPVPQILDEQPLAGWLPAQLVAHDNGNVTVYQGGDETETIAAAACQIPEGGIDAWVWRFQPDDGFDGYVVGNQDDCALWVRHDAELTPAPTETPRPIAPARVSAPQPAPAPVAAAATQAPLPTYTPWPTYTPAPTYTAMPTASPLPARETTRVIVVSAVSTVPAPQPAVAAVASPSAVPTAAATPSADAAPRTPLDLGWLRNLAIALIATLTTIVLIVRRRTIAGWKERPNA